MTFIDFLVQIFEFKLSRYLYFLYLLHGISVKISSQKGLKQTHSLGAIVTKQKRKPICRFTKKKLSTVNREEIDIITFTGEKKSSMPYYQADFAVLLLKLLCNQVIIVNKSTEENFSSIKSPKKLMKFQTTTIIAKEMQKSLSKHEIKVIVFYSPLKNKLFLILQQY